MNDSSLWRTTTDLALDPFSLGPIAGEPEVSFCLKMLTSATLDLLAGQGRMGIGQVSHDEFFLL